MKPKINLEFSLSAI
jgi:hypothetical protein